MFCPSRRAVVAGLSSVVLAPKIVRSAAETLLIYCGITMVKPIKELAEIYEKRTGTTVTISQGGSEDLYAALKLARRGDIYFPGSESYRRQFSPEGLLGEATAVGHNVASLMTAKGNPKRIKADLTELLRDDLSVVVCDPDTGSIGGETKRILERAGLMKRVMERAAFFATDSRNLMQAMKTGKADLILNWRATAFFPENRDIVTVLDLPPEASAPARLELNLLTFSARPDRARAFMELAASKEGQFVFRKHGFLDAALVGDY